MGLLDWSFPKITSLTLRRLANYDYDVMKRLRRVQDLFPLLLANVRF